MQGSPSPGARRKSGHRGNSGIAYGLLLQVQFGGLGAAERAVAPEGRGLAPRSAGSVRVRLAVALRSLPDATRLSAQGSIRLGLRTRFE